MTNNSTKGQDIDEGWIDKNYTHLYSAIYPAADITLGSILCVCAVVGTLANFLFIVFLRIVKKTSDNQAYFMNIFLSISVTDFAFCVGVFPCIAVFFTAREPVFFGNFTFCFVWATAYEVLTSLTVFSVALLSVSRMVMLIAPNMKFRAPLGFILPGLYALLTLGIKIVLLATYTVKTTYTRKMADCYFTVPVDEGDLSDIMRKQQIARGIAATQLAIPILPITLSFVISNLKLYHTKRQTERVNGSTKLQNDATVTIFIVTFAYIALNMPCFGEYVRLMSWIHDASDGTFVKYEEYFNTGYLMNYTWVCTFVVYYAVNSTINPLIYIARMKKFRKFMLNLTYKPLHAFSFNSITGNASESTS